MNQILLENLNALLITNPINIRYLTGFIGLAPHEREGYCLLTKDKTFLLTNPLYIEQANKLSNDQIIQSSNNPIKIEVLEITREKPLTKRIREAFDALQLTQATKLGFEDVDLTVAEYARIKQELPTVQLTPTRNRVELLRMVKRPDEISNIKKAAEITDAAFEFILKQIKPGVTEADLAWELETFFKKNGAVSAFPPIVAFNENSSQPHYASSATGNLKPKTLILLDFGALYNGYCADMTRVVFFGSPTDKQQKAYKALKVAQQAGLDLLQQEERSGANLDQAVRDALAKYGLPAYPHSLGHSLGLAIHEGPRLSVKNDEVLKPGNVFTVEPGIYIPGKFGLRLEDLVWITEKNEVEVLSKSSKELIVLT